MRKSRWALPGLCLALAGLAWPALAQVDLAPYLKRDPYGTIKISPTGEYYAATALLEDQVALVVLRRSDKAVTANVGGRKHSAIEDFDWVNDERVLISMAERFGSQDEPRPTGELYGVNADGKQSRLVYGRFGLDGTESRQRAAFLIDTLDADDRSVLVSSFMVGADPLTRVEKVNVYTGRGHTVASAPVRRARFIADAAGEVRFAVGAGYDNVGKLYYRDNRDADWKLVNDEAESGVGEWPLGFSADGRVAYLQREHRQGPDALVAYDIASGERRELLRDAVADPYAIIRDPKSGVPVGAHFMHAGFRSAFFDETSGAARMQRKLEKAFPGQGVVVTSGTDDGRLLVVQTFSERSPGDFYLFDLASNTASLIFSRREWIDPAKAAPTKAIELKARDGLVLHGYLTQPAAGDGKPSALVVMPHGGPYGIFDAWGFDDHAQMLAAAGYAVLRVNFRGSGNYGRAFMQAGAREWGGKMQDDLTDATRWAIAHQIADPARICIFGASYGGYAALMAVAREPALYRCAAGYVGVYDLELMHRQDSRSSRSLRTWAEEWVGSRGSLASASPSRLADAIEVPVFLAAGGEDTVAPIAHSKRMEKALRDAGTPVETLYFDSEGHGFYTEPHRREFYTKLLDFLARHLGGQRAR